MFGNCKGASLIEVMFGVGIMSLISLGMANMISNVSQQVSQQEAKLNVINAKNDLLTNVQSTNACTTLLSGQSIGNGAPLNIGEIRQGAQVGHQLQIQDVIVSNVTVVNPSTNAHSATVTVQFVNTHNSNISYKPLEFVLYYTTNNGSVDTCGNSGTVENLRAACNSMGASWDSNSNSCGINRSVCESFGGTYSDSGSGSTCTGLGETPSQAASCDPVTFAANQSTRAPYSTSVNTSRCLQIDRSSSCYRQRMRGGRSNCTVPCLRYEQAVTNFEPSECQIGSGQSSQLVTGSCVGNGASGSCSYQCLNGTWTRSQNTCNKPR